MNQVLLVWTESNPSTMEKEFLMLNGLEKCGVKAYALGFSHSKSNKLYFENVYAKHALYSYSFGNERSLYQGGNYIEKIYSNLFLFFWFSVKLFRQLRKQATSVIIIPTNPLEITLPAVVLGKVFGVSVMPNIMEYEPALPSFHKKKSISLRWSWALITKYSDAYIVISRFLEDKMKQLSNKAVFRLPAILPSKSTDEVESSANIGRSITDALPDEVPVLVYASSTAYDDLLTFCLDALSQLGDKDFYLAITGEYSSAAREHWLEKARGMGLAGKIGFTGFLSDAEMYNLQLQSKALLMPLLDNDRHRARFPQKILGYMRLGKPVITTRVGELGEYFEDADTVLMDDTITAHGYSEKIRFLLDHPDQANEIALRGSCYVESRFNESTLGNQLTKFLNSLCSTSG